MLLAAVIFIGGYLYGNINSAEDEAINIINVDEIPSQVLKAKGEGLASGKYINTFVDKIVDGDTIKVEYKGESLTVRLLDVDTPESVKRGVPVQQYGKEAFRFTEKMTLNREVRLVFEKGLRDKYGRLLAHVLLQDGKYLNALLVRNGYARVEIVSPNTALRDYFNELQEEAVDDRTGLWRLPDDKQPFVKDRSGKYVPSYLSKEKAS